MKKYLRLLLVLISSMIMLTGCIAFQASDDFISEVAGAGSASYKQDSNKQEPSTSKITTTK